MSAGLGYSVLDSGSQGGSIPLLAIRVAVFPTVAVLLSGIIVRHAVTLHARLVSTTVSARAGQICAHSSAYPIHAVPPGRRRHARCTFSCVARLLFALAALWAAGGGPDACGGRRVRNRSFAVAAPSGGDSDERSDPRDRPAIWRTRDCCRAGKPTFASATTPAVYPPLEYPMRHVSAWRIRMVSIHSWPFRHSATQVLASVCI
jgi:hypothetical protein